MTDRLRRGRLNAADLAYIRAHETDPPEAIAAHLNRHVNSIRSTLAELAAKPAAALITDEVRQQLDDRFEFKQIMKEFNADEVEYFRKRYLVLVDQFKQDLLSTEETQLFNLIKLELLATRNLQDRRRATLDIDRLQKLLEDTYRGIKDRGAATRDEQDFCLGIENQLAASRAAASAKAGEYLKLLERSSAVMHDLKSTRTQRIERIENSKVSFLDLIRSFSERSIMEREGRAAGLAQLATAKAYKEFGDLHTYIDGSLDRIILSPETLPRAEPEEANKHD